MVITAADLALVVANIVAVAGLAALIIALHIQVRAVEEPYLRERHGDAYSTYAASTGRFLPRLGRGTCSLLACAQLRAGRPAASSAAVDAPVPWSVAQPERAPGG